MKQNKFICVSVTGSDFYLINKYVSLNIYT